MLFLKIETKGVIRFYKFMDVDYVSLRKNKIKIDAEGDIEFNYIGKKWYLVNKTLKKLKYGKRHLRINKDRLLKLNKPIKVNETTITALNYVKKKVKTISPGLAKQKISLNLKSEYLIGRAPDCDIVIDNPQVDLYNTRIIHDGDIYYIEDLKSSNGLRVNGKKVKHQVLKNYDEIMLPGALYMFINNELLYSKSKNGIKIDVLHVSKRVKEFKTKKPILLVDDISLTINEGEYVAIVGGSGAGKSTFVDCINGNRPMTSGHVYYDLNDYYEYLDSYQKIVGYVPQSDIMHTDLTVYKTLYYYAQIRIQHHLNKEEIEELLKKVLMEVSLYEKKDLLVSSLSGGQKKRVSIAMELLANPKVIFLDEPTSGLSPDLDYELMVLLQKLSRKGKTIIIITHNMENVDKCDKIAFLGKGGHLCYYGTHQAIFKYFGVKKYGEIFNLLSIPEKVLFYEDKLRHDEEYLKMVELMDQTYSEVKTNA